MGIVTPGNVAMGPGTLYVADFGATEPAADAEGIASTPGAIWTDVGGTLGGLSVSFNQDVKGLEFDQITMEVGGRITKTEVVFKAKLAEITLDNLTLAMNGGVLSSGSGYDKYEPDISGTENEPDYKALIYDGFGAGGHRRRVIIRKCLNTEAIELEGTKDGQQVIAVSFKAYYVSNAIKPYSVLQATSGS